MAVEPTQPDRVGGLGLGRARRTPEETAGQHQVDRGRSLPNRPKDSIEISGTAEELQHASSSFVPGDPELSPERLQQVLGRISEGFYLRPEVRTEVARRLAKAIANI